MESNKKKRTTSSSTTTTTVSKEEVIAKLKEDGDFDNLRLNIIRKLKDNEELRNNIISIVRHSAALNRAGAESLTPRQLFDDLYDEVGNKLTSQVSAGVWKVIRSADGMKNEITETVQSVYNKLVNPERKEDGESSTHGAMVVDNGTNYKGLVKASSVSMDDNLSNSDPNEPPGFSLSNNHQNSYHEKREELQLPIPREAKKKRPNHSEDMLEVNDVDLVPPGFSADAEPKEPCDSSDEDPDVPPGFG
ncbi:Midasin [Salix suchowensis]|nr:Midasin [Salix suchowensis]